MVDSTRGVLFPERLPSFARLAPGEAVAALVQWFWIPEWSLAPGRVSRQELVGFPAVNVVVEPDGVVLSGPTTRSGVRELTGTGWAVGALLRPAATAALVDDPGVLVDRVVPIDEPALHAVVVAAMSGRDAGRSPAAADEDPGALHRRVVEAFSAWLSGRVPPPSDEALLANRMADVLLQDAGILTVGDAAARLEVSARTLQRLARRHVGVSPAAMIRRRRLQEAAQRLRETPGVDLAALAAELGYADHAHLTRDFRHVLAFTPSAYRAARDG